LNELANFIRARLVDCGGTGGSDGSAVLPSECIFGDNDTVSLDLFLFDEEDEERLEEEGLISRARCNQCGSTDTTLLRKQLYNFLNNFDKIERDF